MPGTDSSCPFTPPPVHATTVPGKQHLCRCGKRQSGHLTAIALRGGTSSGSSQCPRARTGNVQPCLKAFVCHCQLCRPHRSIFEFSFQFILLLTSVKTLKSRANTLFHTLWVCEKEAELETELDSRALSIQLWVLAYRSP